MTIHRNHRIVWPMVRNHRKPLKAMVEKSKTIEKPLMAMVRQPKNIQWWWSPQKPLKICNGLFTFLDPRYVDLYALEEDVLQRIVEDISRCYLIFHSSLKYLDMILSSFGDMILTRDSIVNLKTIVDHCPQNFENHRKTIGSNGWTPKKTFNGDGPTLSKPLKNHWRQWWPKKKH